jgi:hypothetical protein
MSQYPVILAGMDPTASLLQAFAPFMAYKSNDQSVTSSTALVSDTAISLPVAANAVYFFGLYLDYEGAATGAGGLRWGWTFPTGLTMRYAQVGNSGTTLTPNIGNTYLQTTVGTAASDSAGVLMSLLLFGTVAVGSTAGTLQLQWAQQSTSATATIVHAASVLGMWRIS